MKRHSETQFITQQGKYVTLKKSPAQPKKNTEQNTDNIQKRWTQYHTSLEKEKEEGK
jgi:hypothetical protein